jgi:hypothetical protein
MRLNIHVHCHHHGEGSALADLREEIATMNEVLGRLLTETRETRGKLDSATTFIRGVPELIRAAIEKALRDNPSLSAEDLAAISAAADDLDAGQAEIDAAIAEGAPAENGNLQARELAPGEMLEAGAIPAGSTASELTADTGGD